MTNSNKRSDWAICFYRAERSGFAIPLVVVMLIMLAGAIFAMMFFSGSQTRSMANDIELWQARELAISAVKYAGEKLREGRWYGQASVVGSLSSKVPGGGYVVVCEDTKRVLDFSNEYENAADMVSYNGKKYSKLAVLDHVDVFARGFFGDQSVVTYGRFIVGPEADFLSKSTDGLIRSDDGKSLIPSPFTLKRMVSITVINDRSLFDISLRSVRNSIRDKVSQQTASFIQNYGRVRWDAPPPTTISTQLDTNSAKGILSAYWGPSAANQKNVFLRDRVKKLILEGTPVAMRESAAEKRTYHIKKPSGNLRSQYPNLSWPAPVNVTTDFSAPNAFEALEMETGANVISDDYRNKLSYNQVGTSATVTWGSDGVPVNPPEIGGPIIKPYTIKDPSLGIEGIPLDSAFGFFEKYFQEGNSEVLGSESAEAFSQDVYEQIQMPDAGDSTSSANEGATGDNWETNPEIIIIPGPPEPLPEATSGNSPGSPEELGTVPVPPSPGGSSGGGGGSVSGSC